MGDLSSLQSQASTLGSNGLSNEEILNGDVANSSPTRPYVTPIAICGMALRLPGGVSNTEAFWDALYEGKDMRSPIPKDRFNIDAFDDALGNKGVIRPRYGYFLDDDLACLDASFFGMSKSELEKTDPQQRQLLEVTRECLENAGEVNYRGKPVGCYVGTFGDDWMESQAKENQFSGGYNFGIGNDLMIANRVSFEYDFKGPRYVNFRRVRWRYFVTSH
jgi:acyl transferase domain-containing protein